MQTFHAEHIQHPAYIDTHTRTQAVLPNKAGELESLKLAAPRREVIYKVCIQSSLSLQEAGPIFAALVKGMFCFLTDQNMPTQQRERKKE
jgi:hypothetical protein